MKKVNFKVAIIAIYYFLSDNYYDNNNEIGGFLGSLMPMADGIPVDQAILEDWLKITNKSEEIEFEDSYILMMKFLEYQFTLGWEDELKDLLKNENFNENKPVSLKQLSMWSEAIKKASKFSADL